MATQETPADIRNRIARLEGDVAAARDRERLLLREIGEKVAAGVTPNGERQKLREVREEIEAALAGVTLLQRRLPDAERAATCVKVREIAAEVAELRERGGDVATRLLRTLDEVVEAANELRALDERVTLAGSQASNLASSIGDSYRGASELIGAAGFPIQRSLWQAVRPLIEAVQRSR